MTSQEMKNWTWETAQSLTCLLHKHEDLNLDTSMHVSRAWQCTL